MRGCPLQSRRIRPQARSHDALVTPQAWLPCIRPCICMACAWPSESTGSVAWISRPSPAFLDRSCTLYQCALHPRCAGRCDYWGPFVNRAARYSSSAAHGGQIMVPAAMACKLVSALTGQSLLLDQERPLLLAPPDYAPTQLTLRPAEAVLAGPHPHAHCFEGQRLTQEVRRTPCSGLRGGM